MVAQSEGIANAQQSTAVHDHNTCRIDGHLRCTTERYAYGGARKCGRIVDAIAHHGGWHRIGPLAYEVEFVCWRSGRKYAADACLLGHMVAFLLPIATQQYGLDALGVQKIDQLAGIGTDVVLKRNGGHEEAIAEYVDISSTWAIGSLEQLERTGLPQAAICIRAVHARPFDLFNGMERQRTGVGLCLFGPFAERQFCNDGLGNWVR